MKSERIRILLPLCILALAFIGFAANIALGTLSSFGIDDISLICPLGALATMIATRTVIPRAVVSLVIAALFIVVLGRAFCGWLCPIPVVEKLRDTFAPKRDKEKGRGVCNVLGSASCGSCTGTCVAKRGDKVDVRHIVLVAALVSTLIFGFPVFCLGCPAGLTFGTIFLFVNLFTQGDLSWATVVIPLILLLEVVIFKKWCHAFCPLGAFFSLIGKGNKTFVPTVEEAKCIEGHSMLECGICAKVCPEGINPRHMDLSSASMCECTKCRQCVEKCPGQAITMPVLVAAAKGKAKGTKEK